MRAIFVGRAYRLTHATMGEAIVRVLRVSNGDVQFSVINGCLIDRERLWAEGMVGWLPRGTGFAFTPAA